MYSHHSHSGSYCQHGSSPLESMIEQAETLQMKLFCLTEHIPRKNAKYLYPEEKNDSTDTVNLTRLEDDFTNFVLHAQKIKRERSDGPTKYIIGMEVESCDDDQIMYTKEIMNKYEGIIKFCVGSVHHVNGIPIDFDSDFWNLALKSCDNNIKTFLITYFNDQYKMLQVIKPLIVGHFDVYKLFLPKDLEIDCESGEVVDRNVKDQSLSTIRNTKTIKDIPSLINHWDEVKDVVVRNLKFISSYGGLLEINTSALRKNLAEPYPGKDICALAKEYSGSKFVLSDDSHSVSQVATCYLKALHFITDIIQLEKVYYLNETAAGHLEILHRSIEEFKNDPFWLNKKLT
ncbi:hypothetical protein RI543_001901 [Arxiozyma heterogenica]|uniref:Histidinol-phosphatase n=1 Tax=Arxiozyma heterogenica TaxID=278026 RepID=A0AAN7WTI0_9SACH|nr:hypothetical protein RI543_001901 [Kazachstania heterogenica]